MQTTCFASFYPWCADFQSIYYLWSTAWLTDFTPQTNCTRVHLEANRDPCFPSDRLCGAHQSLNELSHPPKHIGLFENMNQALFKPDQRALLGIQTQMSSLWLWSKIYACVLMKHYACVMASLLLKNGSKGMFCFKPSSMVSCDYNPVVLLYI